jgi:hypothetical protein
VNALAWTGLGLVALLAYLWVDHRRVLRRRTRPCADERGYGPEDEAHDPGELLYEPPPGVPGCGDRRPL